MEDIDGMPKSADEAMSMIVRMLEPLERMGNALKELDPRAGEILALHAVVEREMDISLARSMPHPSRLRNLGFVQKLQVLAALSEQEDEVVERWAKPCSAFNDLRNAIAHGDSASKIDERLARLVAMLPEIEGQNPHKNEAHWAAAFILGNLATLAGRGDNLTKLMLSRLKV